MKEKSKTYKSKMGRASRNLLREKNKNFHDKDLAPTSYTIQESKHTVVKG